MSGLRPAVPSPTAMKGPKTSHNQYSFLNPTSDPTLAWPGPLTARPALASLAAAAVAFSLATLLTAAVSEMLLCWNVTLFPVAQGLCSGPLHLAVRLGSVANVKRILAQPGWREEGVLPAHEAAFCGEVGVLIALKEHCGSEAMDVADEQGRRPLHLAVASGSVEVLRFLAETQARQGPILPLTSAGVSRLNKVE